jgi:hypothetical protein
VFFCDVEGLIKDRDKNGGPIGQQQWLSPLRQAQDWPSFYKRMLTMAVATSTGSGLAIVLQESTPQFYHTRFYSVVSFRLVLRVGQPIVNFDD